MYYEKGWIEFPYGWNQSTIYYLYKRFWVFAVVWLKLKGNARGAIKEGEWLYPTKCNNRTLLYSDQEPRATILELSKVFIYLDLYILR